MILFFFGAPGVGKGTQADLLVDKYKFIKFSMGDILRKEVTSGSNIGKQVEEYLKKGVLAPDDLVFEIVENFVLENLEHSLLFDGFPRNLNQAMELEKLLARHNKKITLAIELQLSKEEIIKRMLGRSYCPTCARVYNDITNPPKAVGICDNCGNKLDKRKDDNSDVILNRLRIYEEETYPLVNYYKSLGVYKQVDASGPKEVVQEKIIRILNDYIK